MAEFSLVTMRICVEREIRLREKHYPRWVSQGKLTQAAADHEIACMKAVLDLLLHGPLMAGPSVGEGAVGLLGEGKKKVRSLS